jgi:hypothetical protein
MEVAEQPLLTVEQMAEWYRVGQDAIVLAEKLAAPAFDLRQAVSGIYTSVPLGVYLDYDGQMAAIEQCGTAQDNALVKSAVSRLFPVEASPDFDPNKWVKVAYSPIIRGAGEALGFFPHADAAGNLSGSPSPIRSMLTTGLVGAGLGYGAGALAEAGMPNNWRHGRLRKTLAAVGGVPGAVWGAANHATGKPFNDNSLLYHAPGEEPNMGLDKASEAIPLNADWKRASALTAARYPSCDADLIKAAFDGIAMPWELASRPGPTPMDVNIDSMGKTLWDVGASPQLAGATMGALAAAQQMPGGRDDDPGWVTPSQMANLAAHMGAGYVSGALVGSTLGLLTGMPDSAQNTLKRTGMYLGVVKSVLPRLFGQ